MSSFVTKSLSCLLITSDLQVCALNIGKTNCITLSCSNIADMIVFCLCAIVGGLRDLVILHAMESSRQRSEDVAAGQRDVAAGQRDVAAGQRDVAAGQRDMVAVFSAERSLQEKILDAVLEKRDE